MTAAGDNIWGVLIAIVALVGVVITARRGPTANPPAAPSPEQLQSTPQAWAEIVSQLAQDRAQGAQREQRLLRLLRIAVRALTRAHRQLRAAGVEPEPMEPELIPYSID